MVQKKEIFLVPYAHLDTQWRWEFPTTINKYIKNTIEKNTYLFEKYPEHRFNFTGALRYAFMKEYYPEGFEKVKKYIEEGRWALNGTCLDETDALVPSVESMIRNILYGDRWAKQEFGKTSKDYMIPDCFGFPANMPSVMAHCGIHGFSSQKLTWKSAVGIPFEIGVWNGPDGKGVVSALNPGSYASKLNPPIYKNKKRLKKLEKLGQKNGIWKSFQYYGVGDVGGAPKEASVKRAIASMEHAAHTDDGLVVRQGSSDQFFGELTEDEKQRMDTYAGDLLLINHSAGTLTSAAIMKRWNRKNEQMAFAAEVAAVTALSATGLTYPEEKIKAAWFRTIQNQMHDILPGTSTPTAYEYSQNDEVVALNTWTTILEDSALAIAPLIKGEGTVLLFNPLGETRKDAVDIELSEWDEAHGSQATMTNAEGVNFPAQVSQDENGAFIATFIPDLKPFGWSRYTISPLKGEDNKDVSDTVSVTSQSSRYILENSNYRVEVARNGAVASIFHKQLKKELLQKPLAYELQKEKPSMYPSWNMDWSDRQKSPFHRIESGGTVSISEKGPLRCTLQIITDYNDSTFVKEISLSRDSPMVEFTEKINWRELGCSLKLALNTTLSKPEVTYNWETSRINRGINSETLFEMPSRLWADMSENNWGISIVEDSKYGYDHPADETLRMTLLYTPATRFYNGFRDQKYHGWGNHTIRYAIHGHKDDFKGTDHLARRFNQGVRTFNISQDTSSGDRKDLTLFEVSGDQIAVTAVKKPEDTEGILIRLYERYGKDATAELTFGSDIAEVKEVNGIEIPMGDVSFSGKKFTASVGANGISSYIVKLADRQTPGTDKQGSLKLAYNCQMIGAKGDNKGIYPVELTPAKITAGSITYNLSTDASKNAVQCQGQKVAISSDYNTLSILVGAEEGCESPFKWVDKEGSVVKEEFSHIPAMTGFIGQWDARIWKREPKHFLKNRPDYIWLNECTGIHPGYVNRDRLEWHTTHTHKNGQNQAYKFGYMYTITLDIPKGAESLVLPEDDRVYIIAMTASQQDIKVTTAQHLRDKFDF